ncbi:4Fe-4S dicluster domain-containing protein [Desulfonatronum parangueonense]
MKPVTFREDRCKGCSLCITVCPKEIITVSPRFNKSGYKVVEVTDDSMESCTSCAACALICPDYAISVWRNPAKDKKGVQADVLEG